MAKLNRSDPALKGKLDLDRIGMAGHSFGAYTTLAVAGQLFPVGGSQPEPRIKAAIPISPNAPRDRSTLAKSFGAITIPTLHLTGTRDESPIDPTLKPADRRLAFDHAVKSERDLAIFDGADHMVFAVKPRASSRLTDEKVQDWVRICTTAFWDAYLKNDAKAKAWLTDEFAKELGSGGTFEHKPAAK